MDEQPDAGVPQTVDEVAAWRERAVRDVALLFGPCGLAGLLARIVYRSTCEARAFYDGTAGPAHLMEIVVTAASAFLMWEIPAPIARSGFALVLIAQLLQWRWTFTGIPASQPALWSAYLIAWLLLTITATRGATIRRQALAVALFAVAFALAW